MKRFTCEIDPNKAELIYQLFETRLQDVITEEEGKRPKAQSVAVATVLNQDWLAIYNDESEWGYSKVHGKPEDMSRLHGLYTDETMRCPLKFYKDEGSNLFSDYEILYIEYISSNLKNTVELWPEFFKRMVAAKLANDAGPSLRMEGADVDNARGVFAERKSSALSNDAAASPPMVIPSGSWNKSRNRSNGRCR